MSNLYSRIAELCERHGITGYKLCKETGLSPSVITDLKMGRKKGMSAENAEKIASYFGVSISYLLGNEQKENPAAHSDEVEEYLQAVHDRPELKVLFKKGKNATKEQLAAILALLPDNDED